MKIKILMAMTFLLLYGTSTWAESTFFYDDTKLNNKVDALDKKIGILDSKYTKVEKQNRSMITLKKQNRSLIRSLKSLKNRHSELANSFSEFKKNVHEKIRSAEKQHISQYKDISKKIKNLESMIGILTEKNEKILQQFEKYQDKTKSQVALLEENINTNSRNIMKTSEVLGTKIESTKKTANKLGNRVDSAHDAINKSMSYWVTAISVILLFILVLFIFFRKAIFTQKVDLKNTREQLEEKGIQLDNKLINILESQLKIIENNARKGDNEETDHTLALKVADEIIRIQKNLTRMDSGTKGLKQLKASVARIQDNFAANGYELVEMLGMPYNEGMKVTANFIPDDELEDGEQIITRIIKPQVNYKGVMIQSAQIEVSQA